MTPEYETYEGDLNGMTIHRLFADEIGYADLVRYLDNDYYDVFVIIKSRKFIIWINDERILERNYNPNHHRDMFYILDELVEAELMKRETINESDVE